MLDKGEPLPVDFSGRFIYYVGPVDPVRDEVVGPAGPTTATRMDKFTEQVLAQTGLLGMVGKAERGPVAIEAIRKHKSVYLMAVGGAAYLVSKAIKAARVVALRGPGHGGDLRIHVQDMPVTVAVDSAPANRCTRPGRANGRRGSAGFRWWWSPDCRSGFSRELSASGCERLAAEAAPTMLPDRCLNGRRRRHVDTLHHTTETTHAGHADQGPSRLRQAAAGPAPRRRAGNQAGIARGQAGAHRAVVPASRRLRDRAGAASTTRTSPRSWASRVYRSVADIPGRVDWSTCSASPTT